MRPILTIIAKEGPGSAGERPGAKTTKVLANDNNSDGGASLQA
jgi:hypothetical protein